MSVEIGYLGLGSNVGDRRAYLQAAVEDLWAHRVTVLASSSVYETEPVGEVTDQPEFLNVCVEIECGLAPERLLAACQAVESALGRTLAGDNGYVRHGPRPIDIDILLFGEHRHRSHRLHIPHPGLTARRFVLVPLVELAPHLHIPGHGSAAKALAALGDGQQVRCAGAPLDVRA